MPNAVATMPVNRKILNVQYWFSQNVETLENMLGTKLKHMSLEYDSEQGITLSYEAEDNTPAE